MRAKREYRNRDETQVAVLDALVERGQEGMTVLELRTRVDAEIDRLEEALEALKREDLIATERRGGRLTITPADRVVPEEGGDEGDPSLIDRVRERFPI
ncbi:MarR family transcriptional regulator [Halobacteriales archaeon QS_5_70_17]|jgi:DNA-binding transcriptional ArsR family regulator|nr:MAG: MarR family transcriptional regulator [Halobacteriales archaeon QS_5_70_17]